MGGQEINIPEVGLLEFCEEKGPSFRRIRKKKFLTFLLLLVKKKKIRLWRGDLWQRWKRKKHGTCEAVSWSRERRKKKRKGSSPRTSGKRRTNPFPGWKRKRERYQEGCWLSHALTVRTHSSLICEMGKCQRGGGTRDNNKGNENHHPGS